MAEPTSIQLKNYADGLPEVYKTILWSFVDAATMMRRAGTPLSLMSILNVIQDQHPLYDVDDIKKALGQLIRYDFLNEYQDPLLNYVPTALGEKLITALTDVVPIPQTVPELPQPAWA